MRLAGQRFAETRLSDLICQNEAVALEFEGYGKNTITRAFSSSGVLRRWLTLFSIDRTWILPRRFRPDGVPGRLLLPLRPHRVDLRACDDQGVPPRSHRSHSQRHSRVRFLPSSSSTLTDPWLVADPSSLSRSSARTPRRARRWTPFARPAKPTRSSPRPASRDSDRIASSTPCTASRSRRTLAVLPIRTRRIRTRARRRCRCCSRILGTRRSGIRRCRPVTAGTLR